MRAFFSWLQHPLTKGHDIDDPQTSVLRQRIIREKGFLTRLYTEWYSRIRDALPAGGGPVLELGSGGGFLRDLIPDLVASDVMLLPQINVVLAGEALPFANAVLRAIVMTNVFHHIPDVQGFLAEAARVTRSGGRLAMVEPWNTLWSRFVYGTLHHEPFEPAMRGWALPRGGGPLSSANGALPWIVFDRDRHRFEAEFPGWRLVEATPIMPFSYLLSGGVSLRAQFPPAFYRIVRKVEELLPQQMFGMFALVVLERRPAPR